MRLHLLGALAGAAAASTLELKANGHTHAGGLSFTKADGLKLWSTGCVHRLNWCDPRYKRDACPASNAAVLSRVRLDEGEAGATDGRHVRELRRTQGDHVPSSVHTLTIGGKPTKVTCDMEGQDGGWTQRTIAYIAPFPQHAAQKN